MAATHNSAFQGKRRRDLEVEFVRVLDADDMKTLSESPPVPVENRLVRVRESHHALARVIVSGHDAVQASAITGYDPGYISRLMMDPTFQELLASYRADINLAYQDLHEKMGLISKMAADELRERLETEPEKMGDNTLIELLKTGADRTGFGPKQTNVNVNVDLADRLRAARERAGLLPPAESGARVINAVPLMSRPVASRADREEP